MTSASRSRELHPTYYVLFQKVEKSLGVELYGGTQLNAAFLYVE
jgi:hypothetical protein